MKMNSVLALTGLLSAALLAVEATAAGPFLDPSFGNAGKVVTSFPGGLDTATGVAVQPDGKIVVAGSSGRVFALTRYNSDGSFDTAFGTGGRVHTNFPGGYLGQANALVIQPDGKIILAGSAFVPATNRSLFALARYNTDGSLDTTFNGNGVVTTSFPNSRGSANAIALQADGKLVAAGVSTDETSLLSVFALTRYNTNGSLDSTFDGDGRVTTDFGGAQASAVAVQADGRIVAAGQGNSSFALARYNTNGSLDLGFDGDGKTTTAFGGSFAAARAMAIQTDGKIIAAGQRAVPNRSSLDLALARYNTDGSLDNSFNGDGKTTTAFGLDAGAHAVVLQGDGRIVVAGRAGATAQGSFFALARFETNGTLDSDFGGDGKVLTDLSGGRYLAGALGVALQTDGRIIAAGEANSSGQLDFGVVCYNTNGSLDSTFGSGGKVMSDFALDEETVTRLVVQPDGKIVAVGRFNSLARNSDMQDPNFEIARYNSDGNLDQTFGTGGLVSTDFLTHGDDFANAVALQPDGRIIVVGQVGPKFSDFLADDSRFGIARYNPDGSLDTSFDGDGLVTTDFGTPHGAASAVAVQSDGKIVVAGSSGGDFALARYNSNGTLDTAGFGAGGKVTTGAGGFDFVTSLVIEPEGKIVVAGSSRNDFALARYNNNGTLDTAGFGAGGIVTTDFFGGFDSAHDLVLQPDGKLVAAGSAFHLQTGTGDFALARYNSNGTLDTAGFGSGGKVTTDLGGSESIGGLAVQKDGGIVAAGLFARPDDTAYSSAFFVIARYTSSGNLDPNFGTNGTVTVDFFGINNQATAVTLQNDGRIVVGGFADTGSSNDFALVRYTLPRSQLLNIATRMRVQTGENVLIGGFIIAGSDPKQVIIRGIGPSLSAFFTGALPNPTLELFQGNTSLQSNDDWKTDQQSEIVASGIPPSDDLESAIVRTLEPGNYTAILRGKGNSTGIGVVEAYDLNQASNSQLTNIATRGFVETGDNVMIGGLIVGPAGGLNAKVVVRAIGPSLSNFGINGALQNPTLDLVNANGVVLRSNNDWKDSQQTEIEAVGLQPGDDRESTLIETVSPGNYTAIVRGAGNTTGVALVEVYNVQ